MGLPFYTELSNFSTRQGGKKIQLDITVALIINSFSDPVNALNSVFQFLSQTRYKAEFILLNLDKDGYKYDKLLSTFPVMRVLLPQGKISLSEGLALIAHESLARNILYLDEHCQVRVMDLEVMDMYLSENSFGAIIPLLQNQAGEVVPNIVKGCVRKGLLSTMSMDIVGTAVSSIFPKYLCFLLNKDAFISRNIEISRYETPHYTLLELGYRLWKEGFIITQARSFKVEYSGEPVNDLPDDPLEPDYIRFNFRNIQSKDMIKGRLFRIVSLCLKALFQFKFAPIAALTEVLRDRVRYQENNLNKPIEDFAIFSIINKDIE